MENGISNMGSMKQTARFAGVIYLIMILTGMFAQIVRGGMLVSGDPSATVANIVASGSLFTVAFLGDLIMATCYLVFAWALYTVLKPVNKNIALLFVLLTTVSVAILSLNMLNQFAVITLLNGAGYMTAFGTEQLNALVTLFMDLHYHGSYIAQITFGLWLLPLGYLVIKSGFMPKVFGFLLIIAAFGHVAGFFTAFLMPGYESFVDIIAILEVLFGLWLLIKGISDRPKMMKAGKETVVSQ